jgi:hypothetical protein
MSLSTTTFGWLRDGLGNYAAAKEIESQLFPHGYRKAWYVDTVNGADGGSFDGLSWDQPFKSMGEAFANVGDNDVIFGLGDVREELLAPLGVFGVRIIGGFGGNTRHSTEGGVAVSGNSLSWREPASGATTGGALLTLRQQGWEVHNILFVPKSDATAIRLRRAEDATYPDASHAIINRVRIILGAVGTSKGVEDHGGCSHVTIQNSEFDTLAEAIGHTVGAGIDSPNRYVIRRNWFRGNSDHVDLPCNLTLVEENVFFTDATGKNVDVAGGTTGVNRVLMNWFASDQGDITIANGYEPGTADVWRNYSANTAAHTVGVPS